MNKFIKSIINKIIEIIFNNTKAFNYFQKQVENKILENMLNKFNYLNIKNIYDIGANKGEWSKNLKCLKTNYNFILFEASKKNIPYLDKTGFKYFISCLSNEVKEIEFYEIGGTGDSYYKEISDYYSNIKPIKIQSQTISNLISDNNLPSPDLIKIDTQGSEIDILKGLGDKIFDCKIILVEISITETNSNAPLIGDYISFFNSISFSPIEITEKHFSANKILQQIDILFINNKYNG